MAWCEGNGIDYVFGLARDTRLVAEIAVELIQAEDEALRTGRPARRSGTFVMPPSTVGRAGAGSSARRNGRKPPPWAVLHGGDLT